MSVTLLLRKVVKESRQPFHHFTKIALGTDARKFHTSYGIYARQRTMEKINPKTLKLDTPEFKSIFSPELNTLVKLFEKHKYELRISGGAVRDLLIGKLPHDIDFATTATPAEMKDMFTKESIRMLNTNGEKHGTITARINDKENFECTTLRIDIRTDGRHAQVEWTRDWQLDALRRDLTINSLFLGMDGIVYDYFNGIEDLHHKRIRFVGSAADRIQEDYLRILRYFRFFGRIVEDPDSHEADTLESIRQNVNGMQKITGERIWMELDKILTGRFAESVVPVMLKVGLAPYIGLPENTNTDHYRLVCRRTEGFSPKATTRLAALLETTDEMFNLNKRLKLSKEEYRNGVFIIEHRNDTREPDPFRYCKDLHCDIVGKEPKTLERIAELLKYVGDSETLEWFKVWDPPRLPVNGKHLLDAGIQKGPMMHKTLMALRNKWKESDYTLDTQGLLNLLGEVEIKKKEKTKQKA